MNLQEDPVLNKAESRDFQNYINFLIDKNKVKRKPSSGKNCDLLKDNIEFDDKDKLAKGHFQLPSDYTVANVF